MSRRCLATGACGVGLAVQLQLPVLLPLLGEWPGSQAQAMVAALQNNLHSVRSTAGDCHHDGQVTIRP